MNLHIKDLLNQLRIYHELYGVDKDYINSIKNIIFALYHYFPKLFLSDKKIQLRYSYKYIVVSFGTRKNFYQYTITNKFLYQFSTFQCYKQYVTIQDLILDNLELIKNAIHQEETEL